MTAYHYQCQSCQCTMSIDELPPEQEKHVYVSGGVCGSCQSAEQQQQQAYDDDD
jgi:hypothetical protein